MFKIFTMAWNDMLTKKNVTIGVCAMLLIYGMYCLKSQTSTENPQTLPQSSQTPQPQQNSQNPQTPQVNLKKRGWCVIIAAIGIAAGAWYMGLFSHSIEPMVNEDMLENTQADALDFDKDLDLIEFE